uniref:Uncharacterized protein n=1 Tax=Vespula pensylvanica TaxID=30213 RepID=A0A834JLB5_VESPE|nr:hypothetical protein H0235_018090 [Vespula pensylvanica]
MSENGGESPDRTPQLTPEARSGKPLCGGSTVDKTDKPPKPFLFCRTKRHQTYEEDEDEDEEEEGRRKKKKKEEEEEEEER